MINTCNIRAKFAGLPTSALQGRSYDTPRRMVCKPARRKTSRAEVAGNCGVGNKQSASWTPFFVGGGDACLPRWVGTTPKALHGAKTRQTTQVESMIPGHKLGAFWVRKTLPCVRARAWGACSDWLRCVGWEWRLAGLGLWACPPPRHTGTVWGQIEGGGGRLHISRASQLTRHRKGVPQRAAAGWRQHTCTRVG